MSVLKLVSVETKHLNFLEHVSVETGFCWNKATQRSSACQCWNWFLLKQSISAFLSMSVLTQTGFRWNRLALWCDLPSRAKKSCQLCSKLLALIAITALHPPTPPSQPLVFMTSPAETDGKDRFSLHTHWDWGLRKAGVCVAGGNWRVGQYQDLPVRPSFPVEFSTLF